MSTRIELINMIKQQLRTNDVLDDKIIALYQSIARAEFVPEAYKHFAYSDMHIPLPHKQCMMTPVEEAQLLQSLHLKGNEIVLEVGTGSGFLTALLSRLCQRVISIDYFSEFTQYAWQHLADKHCSNVELYTGDACRGWLDNAPYDVVIFTGAIDELTDTHKLQVLPGGRLFTIIGSAPIMKGMLYEFDHQGTWHSSLIFETNIPPLIDGTKEKTFVF